MDNPSRLGTGTIIEIICFCCSQVKVEGNSKSMSILMVKEKGEELSKKALTVKHALS
jgi:hypothetical protein